VHLVRFTIEILANISEFDEKRGTSLLYSRPALPEMYFANWSLIEFALIFNYLASVNSNFSAAFDGPYRLKIE
jgi:hypothetical protein